MKSKTNKFGCAMFCIGVFIGIVVTMSFMHQSPPEKINIEERENEILSMPAADVIDEFIPSIRAELDRIINEESDALARVIIDELIPTFEDIGKRGYYEGYREGRQASSLDDATAD